MRKFIMCTVASVLFASTNSNIINTQKVQTQKKWVPPAAGTLIEEGNFIKNGNFNFPQLPAEYEITSNLPGWTSNEVERGMGSIYNPNWGNTVVVQLDGNQNNAMKQSLALDSGHYILSFKWAARSQYVSTIETSAMSVYWNDKKIFEVQATDKSIHEQVIPLTVWQSGNYILEFRGEGWSDSFGMTIANLKLRRDLSRPKPLPLPPAGTLTEEGNYIKNGNFNFPQLSAEHEVINNIPGWNSIEIQRGVGSIYNSNWGNIVVAELDGNRNNILKQVISLEAGYYILCFKWAARTSYVSTSAMSLYWKGEKIFEVQAKDNSIHSERIPIFVSDSKSYMLQIRGEGRSDGLGMTVTNFRLTKDNSKQFNEEKQRPQPNHPNPINPNNDEYFSQDDLFPEDKKKNEVQIGSTRY